MRVVWGVVAVFFAGFWLGGRVAYTQESLDPLVVDPPQHYHLEFENEFVKVIRCRIGPHEKVAMHRHPVGSVILFVTDQKLLRQAVPDGTKFESSPQSWRDRLGRADHPHGRELHRQAVRVCPGELVKAATH